MSSENRLQRRRLQSTKDEDVVRDNQHASEESPLYNLIGFGLIALGGFAAYKSGMFKGLMGPMLEVADSIARKGDNAAVTMSTIKQWTKLKHLSPGQLANSRQSFSAPEHSIFRDRNSSVFYDLAMDVRDYSTNRFANFTWMRTMLQDSQEDLQNLYAMIGENIQNLPDTRQNYFNTSLSRYISEITSIERIGEHYAPRDSKVFNPQVMKQFIEDMTLTAEKRAAQLNESGYRNVVLSDLMEEFRDADGHVHHRIKAGAPIDIFDSNNSQGRALFDSIDSFLRDPTHWQRDARGMRVSPYQSGAWKNIILDESMKVNENGDFIDFRMTKDNAANFAKSLMNDFGLPVVKFNPVRSFMGLLGHDTPGVKVPRLGLINPNQIDPSITGKGGRYSVGEWLADTFGDAYKDSPIAVIGGKGFLAGQDGRLIQVANNLKLYDISGMDESTFVHPMVNAMRQMAGLNLGEPEKYGSVFGDAIQRYEAKLGRSLSTAEKVKFRTALFLDMGFQEWRPEGTPSAEGFDSATSIDEIVNNFIDRNTRKFRVNGFEYASVEEMLDASQRYRFSSVFGKGFDNFEEDSRVFHPRKFVTTRNGFKITRAASLFAEGEKDAASYEATGFVGQFFSGRNANNEMGEFFTERTGRSWSILNNLNDQFADSVYFLGFSSDSKRSVGTYATNFLLKRALPIYMLTKVPDMVNYFSEPFFKQDNEDGTENRDNITKFLMRKVVKPIDIQAHKAMDFVGATDLFKFMGEMTPGTEQITELPGIHALGLGQTSEERQEYIENGMDPVRKGRWWGSGNTPLTGGKIIYWRPNLYRRIEADVDFSDSKWGSRQEYYNNTWFPNPVNPFAPINHFVLDRNHYDKKHYYDRPYLMTAPEGSNMPLIGPLFGQTVGRVINPPQRMHLEYWRDLKVNPADETVSPLITQGALETSKRFYQQQGPQDFHVFNEVERRTAEQKVSYNNSLWTSSYQAKQVTSRSIYDSAGVNFEERVIFPIFRRFTGDVKNPFEIYTTPSGSMTVVDVPNNLNLYDVNQDLKQFSINKILGTNQRVTISDINGPDIPVGNDNLAIDNAFVYGAGEQYNWLGDIMGLRGFMVQQFMTGDANTNARVIEDSGYAYSLNNDFWEENLGGLGGNLSEITRRFIPKRNNSTEYINPIRNTMPSWMPGSNYMTDFKHGDPYSKVDNGEERLPGQGYERLYHINNVEDVKMKISQIGQDKAGIIRSLFDRSAKTPGDNAYMQELATKGGDIAKHLKSEWKQHGVAFVTDGQINDKRNGITGTYDAMVYDMSSPTGIGVIDIRTVSKKDFNKIRFSRKAKRQHQEQVNYMLWATDNRQSKGYVHYVNRDKPEQTYTAGFKYDDKMLRSTLREVHAARKEVQDAMDKGIIGRGEFYGLMDRYRILADVAPYSQELQDVEAQISMTKLSDAERKEAAQIRERLKQQKEPLRVYPYKFKTSNLKTEAVTVKKIIDNNTFISYEYGDNHAIRFAGINVTESSELANKKTYPRKQRKGLEKVLHQARKKLEEGPTQNEKARSEIRKYVRKGAKVQISYDADERNKFKNDSTQSIRAIVHSRGKNVNRTLVNRGYAKINEDDDSPAGINVRYSKGEIAFGSAMERLTHDVVGAIPFVGSKFYQVRSPYEQYRDREVYGKDFQSWNHPIRDIFMPNMVDKPIADMRLGGMLSVVTGAFMGSLFGKNKFGKLVGGTIGATIPLIGKAVFIAGSDKDRDWRPKRRRDQENLNEYIDTLKYVKNMRLYSQYAQKAKQEDHFDVDKFMKSKEMEGVQNKLRVQELTDYKKKVKLDFKHRGRYNFKYGEPKYAKHRMDRKQTISAINREITELQSNRSVTKVPTNALKAIQFKQAADKTMYGYNPGDSLVNIMSALPKKDRQYFKHFMDAPEEEKEKILRVAPSYMRRALQGAWGLPVDRKPTLQEYFTRHALPNANWVGWDENVNMDSVKVKMVHNNNLDPGEFDIWDNTTREADAVNIPIPRLNMNNDPRKIQLRLQQLFGKAEYDNIQVNFMNNRRGGNSTSIEVRQDVRDDVEAQINGLDY